MDDNPEIRDRSNVNKSTYHNKRPLERFICFIRGAKWTKINHLNGPSPIHDTSTWLSQSIQSIRHVCCRLGMQKNLPWKCFRTAFGHYDFPSTSTSQQAWRMRKRYHLLFRNKRCDRLATHVLLFSAKNRIYKQNTHTHTKWSWKLSISILTHYYKSAFSFVSRGNDWTEVWALDELMVLSIERRSRYLTLPRWQNVWMTTNW